MGASFGTGFAIGAGAIANTSVGIANGNVTNGYSMLQHFVAGALSGYAGFSLHATSAKALSGGKYMRKYLYNNAHKIFAKYGTQSVLSDFAHDYDRKFLKKDIGQHFGTFFFGGLGGIMQSYAISNPLTEGINHGLGRSSVAFGFSMAGYGIEYMGASYAKGNFQGLSNKGWQTKAGVSSFKAIMNSLIIR